MSYYFLDHEDRKFCPSGIGPLMHTAEAKEALGGYSLKKLLKDCEVLQIKGDKNVLIRQIVVDSRRAGPQSLFFAIPGFRQDGHYFLEEALKRGAVALVTDQKLKLLPSVTVVQVKDVRAVLATVARAFYQEPDRDLSLLGVTGTNGKTTVTFLLHQLLSTAQAPVGLLGTILYDLGKRSIPAHRTTPDALELYALLHQMKHNACKQVVMEVSSHGIDQKRIAGLQFEVGAFLNLSQDHMDYHGSMETYFQTKLRFFTEGNYPKKVAVNVDDVYGKRVLAALPSDVEVVTFGMGEEAQLRAEALNLNSRGAEFQLRDKDKEKHLFIESPLVGEYNVNNVLAVFAILKLLHKPIEAYTEKLKAFTGVPGRLEKVEAGQAYTILVDYAHTDDALHKMLHRIRAVTLGKLFVVFGCGGDRDKLKRSKMTEAVQTYANHAWATTDNPRTEAINAIFEDMQKGVSQPSAITFEPCRKTAIYSAIKAASTAEDTVVIAGKGHETYQEFSHTIVPFDDRLVAKEAVQLKALSTPASYAINL